MLLVAAMQHEANATPCPASPPDPQPDRSHPTTPGQTTPARTIPARIAALLHTVRILLGYGRHLAETAPHRAASTDFNAVAACFGTGRLYTILAHLQRGLLRATALEHVLLARAARGRDIDFAAPRERAIAAPAATADPSAGSPAGQPAEAHAVRKPRRSRPAGWNDPELFMPTLEELVAQVRRRPLGRTLVEICLDLAVVPGFCTGAFWNELFDSIRLHGGSIATLMQEKLRREEAFSKEQDRTIGSNWDWLEMGREALRRVLGCFIGEAADAAFGPDMRTICPGPGGGLRPFLTFSHECTEVDARGRTTAGPAVAIRECAPPDRRCDRFHRGNCHCELATGPWPTRDLMKVRGGTPISSWPGLGPAMTGTFLRGAKRQSNLLADERNSAQPAGDCFGAPRLAMTGGSGDSAQYMTIRPPSRIG